MKRFFSIILILVFLALTLCGCGNSVSIELTASEGEAADGFTWKNNYSEITITGYVGSLNDIVIPSKINGKPVTAIAKNAFKGFDKLKSVVIPESVKIIDSAFVDCNNLEEITLSEGLESMAYAFSGCVSVKSIVIPNSVKNITRSFENCSALEKANIPINAEHTVGAFEKCQNLVSVSIPEGVKTISGAFRECTSLKSVSLPEGLESMGSAFYGCVSLQNTTVPNTVTYINGAFGYCTSMTEIVIPENAAEGAGDSFSNTFEECTSLKKLVLPDSYKGEVKIEGIPCIEEISMSKESLEATLDYSADVTHEICNETSADWYQKMMNVDLSFYRYNSEFYTINGTREIYERIYSANDVPVETYEEKEESNGRIFVKRLYFLAMPRFGDECVICETTTYTYYIEAERMPKRNGEDYFYDDEGNFVYEEYKNDTVSINGEVFELKIDE